MVLRTLLSLGLLLLVTPGLGGCAAVLAGGAVATGVAAGGTALAEHDLRSAGSIVEDQVIEQKASNAILNDHQLRGRVHIDITSFNMRVLMTGEAPSEELRDRAADLVRRVYKVRQVHNEVQISGPTSMVSRTSDTYLTGKVKTELLAYRDFDGTRVKVVSENGTVYLMGLLYPKEADMVTNTVRNIGGVQKVVPLFETPTKS